MAAIYQMVSMDYRPSLRSLLKALLETQMEAERNTFLGRFSYMRSDQSGNEPQDYRNGYSQKWLHTAEGKIRLYIPRTRSGEFYPTSIKYFKRRQAQALSLLKACLLSDLCPQVATDIWLQHFCVQDALHESCKLADLLANSVYRYQETPDRDIYAPLKEMTPQFCAL